MTSPWLIRTREAAKFAGGLLVLLIGIVGAFAWVLIWSEVVSP